MSVSLQQQDRTVLNPDNIGVATVYAEALAEMFPGPEKADDARDLADELTSLGQLIHEIDGGAELLAAALLNNRQRNALVQRVFGGKISPAAEQLLGVLGRNHRLGLIGAIGCQLDKLLDSRRGLVEVIVRTAIPLADDQRQELKQTLAKTLKADPVLNVVVDPEILGGLVIQVGDTVYDASVAGDIDRIVEAMKTPGGTGL
ncbi:MAG: ATP synthase F1 subunit delta [Phycisphaerae bacterium]|nr:ATP synthase F1 subunit delta [Phycisphaerae bacterium]